MIIRQANTKDMPAIKALIRTYPKQLMQNHLPQPREFFVASVKGVVVGCCALEIYSRRIAEIRSLAVHPDHTRRLIGRRLVGRCLKKAKKEKIYEVFCITGKVQFFKQFGLDFFKQERYALFRVLRPNRN